MAGLMTWEELERHGLTECDPRDSEPLDQRLFGNMMADPANPVRDTMCWLRELLTAGADPMVKNFASKLRDHVELLRLAVRFPAEIDLPEPGDIHALRASMRDAVTHIEGWAKRHGYDMIDTAEEDSAARQGWPDETGKGWTPPWDILGMTPPDYWGSPDQST